METLTGLAGEHLTATRPAHLGRSLAEQPIPRAAYARLRTRTDEARAFLTGTLTALAEERPDAMLRVLQVKAVAAEAASEVADGVMRLCGGSAFRKELGVERRFRDALAARVMAPTTEALHDFVARASLHGDHIGGERDAAMALAAGEVAAACMIDANHLLFGTEGVLPAGSTRIIAQTAPYDHCNLTVVDTAPGELAGRFAELLTSMSLADRGVRPLLELEGLTAWLPGRDSGYAALETAVGETGFYDAAGAVTAGGYVP